ncbi:glycosyltransferase family 2 protein [Neptuniibacter sp. CAU 1671]|uniref:glycosyltransferase family 2 protein n=1 Tax=Neptuniibacter sp. CAU 1671 TaxID=3032593 RepID=UPI0023D9D6AD|nr:glycosyltransferase family 2 protein [Neptuniibacter sp. CAU 1671]MDF2181401.1 glycosyltransferase family 2 protein [Neptuniibacter sp. CAU 1671]
MSHSGNENFQENNVKLSICIATRNRSAMLSETLQIILPQLVDKVEVVVVDGASSDDTSKVMEAYASRDPRVQYYREAINGGIDQDYDKAVEYASGAYCWLMPDDDWILPDAIDRVLSALESKPSAVIVDAQVRDENQSEVLLTGRCSLKNDQFFRVDEHDSLFLAVADQLSYIGSVVIDRALWLSRDRQSYFGSFFIHMGVLFQAPLPAGAQVLAAPCIAIRYGNASWTARSFEIWTVLWPKLLMSLSSLSYDVRLKIAGQYTSLRSYVALRAKGAYSLDEYQRWVLPSCISRFKKILFFVVAVIPGVLLNFLHIVYVSVFKSRKEAKLAMIDLSGSRYYVFKLNSLKKLLFVLRLNR